MDRDLREAVAKAIHEEWLVIMKANGYHDPKDFNFDLLGFKEITEQDLLENQKVKEMIEYSFKAGMIHEKIQWKQKLQDLRTKLNKNLIMGKDLREKPKFQKERISGWNEAIIDIDEELQKLIGAPK